MSKEKFAILIFPNCNRIDIPAENLAEAAALAIKLFFDLDKERKIKEFTMNNEKIIFLEGIDNEDENRKFMIFVTRSEAADTIEEFKEFRKLN
jgi:hypothetical protein